MNFTKTETVSPDGEGLAPGHTTSLRALDWKTTPGLQLSWLLRPYNQGRVEASLLEHGLSLLVPPYPPRRGLGSCWNPPVTKPNQPIWGLGQDLIFPFLPLAGSACIMLSQRIATSSLMGPQDWTPSPTTPKHCLGRTGWCGGRERLGRADVGQSAGGQQAL